MSLNHSNGVKLDVLAGVLGRIYCGWGGHDGWFFCGITLVSLISLIRVRSCGRRVRLRGGGIRACSTSCKRSEYSWLIQHFVVFDENPNLKLSNCLLTIEILNAFNVIFMQRKVFHIAVHGVHESVSNVGVIQAEGMSKLVGGHQEKTITWNMTSSTFNIV